MTQLSPSSGPMTTTTGVTNGSSSPHMQDDSFESLVAELRAKLDAGNGETLHHIGAAGRCCNLLHKYSKLLTSIFKLIQMEEHVELNRN